MFFTPELLARRDSGFGLLWLAATLGSKSTFKKLPKRSVLTADIAQLCGLIIQPNEPLALRLSSNLMIGAARIYKVKQDIFFSDVNTCVASLKKTVDELRALGEAQLQMAQSAFRPGALTLAPDPKNAFMMEFDMLVADWDEYLDLDESSNKRALTDEDTDYRPGSSKRAKVKGRARLTAEISNVSAHAHTLVEHHDHVLSASFDISKISHIGDQMASLDPASTQEDFGFVDFFPMSDDQSLGDVLGNELARELGWESALDGQINEVNNLDTAADNGVDMPSPMISHFNDYIHQPSEKAFSPTRHNGVIVENDAFILHSPGGSYLPTNRIEIESPAHGSVISFQDAEPPQSFQPFNDITNKSTPGAVKTCTLRQRPKRTRMFLDARTELTDDELKISRDGYVKVQMVQRRENDAKRLEKEYAKLLETRIYDAPLKVAAPALIDLWKTNLKAHLETKTGDIIQAERPRKRRKVAEKPNPQSQRAETLSPVMQGFDDMEPINEDIANIVGFEVEPVETGLYRSSEEPGQGRYASRPPSVIGSNFGLNVGVHESFSQSQKTLLFPWDNAGPSSSTGMVPFGLSGNDQVFEGQADVHLRGSSRSRRGDSLAPSQIGSNLVAGELSPAPVDRRSQGLAEDYEFDVKSSARNSVIVERRQTEMNVLALERNSLNFLEYTKMQFNTLPNSVQELSFDTIVPKPGSTRHVAAAAFYHCLVLGTKDLLHLKQPEPYGPISITIEK